MNTPVFSVVTGNNSDLILEVSSLYATPKMRIATQRSEGVFSGAKRPI